MALLIIFVLSPETSIPFPLSKTSLRLYISILLLVATLFISLSLIRVFSTLFNTIPDTSFAFILVFFIITSFALTVMAGLSSFEFIAAPLPLNKIALLMFREMSEYSLPKNLTAFFSSTESIML